ncbi:MAG: diadenylate cyclase [Actinomycetota bacterium]|nr:diadenylate cyclase [Actinomycetota bacterium]
MSGRDHHGADGGFFADIHVEDAALSRDLVLSLLELAIELAREGREGRKVGTIFVLGDEDAVLERSRCLILDPLAGHPPESKQLNDPNLRETVKELAQLDGGFVVSADGVVVSAARYFSASLEDAEPMLGLGSRHVAAASVTKQTRALAMVVSESSVVRLFERGRLTSEILPELWLLSRFSSHVQGPRLARHPAENIAVVSRADDAH